MSPCDTRYNTVVLLGPTAVGKTSLGVRLADCFGWEIISADSRQVYKGLDVGSGKDLKDYTLKRIDQNGVEQVKQIPYHMIDVTTLDSEFNVYNFQNGFYTLAQEFLDSGKTPFIVGGTGMYIDSVVRKYRFVEVPENASLREKMNAMTLEELDAMLLELKPDLHNKSDLRDRDRAMRAIEIATYMKENPGCQNEGIPDINALVIGTTLERSQMHSNIRKRLIERIEKEDMIGEIKGLHDSGYSWERLEKLGLEYRFVSQYLEGKISTQEEMTELLYHAICQFAKRQETWFRGMERKGVKINWLPNQNDPEAKYQSAVELIRQNLAV